MEATMDCVMEGMGMKKRRQAVLTILLKGLRSRVVIGEACRVRRGCPFCFGCLLTGR